MGPCHEVPIDPIHKGTSLFLSYTIGLGQLGRIKIKIFWVSRIRLNPCSDLLSNKCFEQLGPGVT